MKQKSRSYAIPAFLLIITSVTEMPKLLKIFLIGFAILAIIKNIIVDIKESKTGTIS
jgi:hypothetical protein